MEILAMSNSTEFPNEVEEIIRMFELGMPYYHVRKPKLGRRGLTAYVKSFPVQYHDRLILHSWHGIAEQNKLGGIHLGRHHRKRKWTYQLRLWLKRKKNPSMVVSRTFHKLTDITSDKREYSYAFLSPVFDSVSQNSLGGGYSRRALLVTLPQAKQPVYALGGVRPENIEHIAELGFHGAVLLGALWKGDEPPHKVYHKALTIAQGLV